MSATTKILERYNNASVREALGEANQPDPVQLPDNPQVFYLLCDKGVIVCKEGSEAFIVITDPYPFFGTWFAQKACTGPLGLPISDHLLTDPSGTGRFQRFEKGSIYWHPGSRKAYFVLNGPIRDKWASLRFERGPLGFPVSNPRFVSTLKGDPQGSGITTVENIQIQQQEFQNGTIQFYRERDTGKSVCIAFTHDGHSLPERNYTLTVKHIRCINESGRTNVGSDEVGLSFVTTTPGRETQVQRWFHGDVDKGETKRVDLTLYSGSLPSALSLSLIGLEKDGPKAFKKARKHFESTMEALDVDVRAEYWTKDRLARGLTGGYIFGAILFGGAKVTPVASSTVTGFSISGGAGGGIVGAIIAVVVLVSVFAGLAWRIPEGACHFLQRKMRMENR